MSCMFCGSEKNLTSEHVFPAFIGGNLEVPAGSCDTCNHSFGVNEATIKNGTVFLLNLLGIENRDGVVPTLNVPAEIRGIDMEGLTVHRDGEGQINLHDVVRDARTADGRLLKRGFFVHKDSADKFTAKGLARGGELIERTVPEKFVVDATATIPLQFAFSIDARKVIAKIALAAIAFEYGLDFAGSSAFDRLRKVQDVQLPREIPVAIFADEMFMALHTRTAHQHSVICYLSAGLRKGWALVTLFGGLSYLVEVSPDYAESQSRQFSIFYDSSTKTRINPIVLADEMKVIGHVRSRETKFEDLGAVYEQWFPLIASFCAEKGYELERVGEPGPPGSTNT